jgi:hypothetical protein
MGIMDLHFHSCLSSTPPLHAHQYERVREDGDGEGPQGWAAREPRGRAVEESSSLALLCGGAMDRQSR